MVLNDPPPLSYYLELIDQLLRVTEAVLRSQADLGMCPKT